MEYSWKVTGLKLKDENGVKDAVIQTYWIKKGIDKEGNEGIFAGATPFTVDDVDNFIPFEELTEDIVLSWIKAEAIGGYEQHINQTIQDQIDQQKEKEINGDELPWAIPSTETTGSTTDTQEEI